MVLVLDTGRDQYLQKKNVNIVLASSLVHYIVLIRMIALLWTRIVSALSSIYW